MTGWNDGKAGGLCRCARCSEPSEPGCRECKADGVELDEQGRCPSCRPDDEETEAEWYSRMRRECRP